jgi:hypothetical protein
MKATNQAAREQSERDKKELIQLNETIRILICRKDPLMASHEARVAEKKMLTDKYVNAMATLKAMEELSHCTMQKLRKASQTLEKGQASEALKQQRGFDCGKKSTFTNKMLRKQIAERWRNAADVGAEMDKTLKTKVSIDSTVAKMVVNL